jgi:hypothetical protein
MSEYFLPCWTSILNLFNFGNCTEMSHVPQTIKEVDESKNKEFVKFLTLIEGMDNGRFDDLHFIYMLLKNIGINVPDFPEKLSEESYERLYFESLRFLCTFAFTESRNVQNNFLIKINFLSYGNKLFTDMSLLIVSMMCPKLKTLNVSSWTEITDQGLLYISQKCPELKTLNLMNCDKITDVGVIQITKMCPKLQYINLMGCRNITDESVKALKNVSRVLLETTILTTTRILGPDGKWIEIYKYNTKQILNYKKMTHK